MKHGVIYGLSFLICITGPRPAHADIVVRTQETSENEFQALAQALGHTPIGDFILNESERKLSNETAELFRQRLLEAQTEWIRHEEPRVSEGAGDSSASAASPATPAIDRFLALATEADWASSERQAFLTFYARKFQVSPDPAVNRAFNAFAGDEKLEMSDLTPSATKLREAMVKDDHPDGVAFPSSLPVDVTALLVDGRAVARQELAGFKFPRVPVRVTLISNVYQPFTLRLNGTERDWPTLNRRPWISENCVVASEGGWTVAKVTVLGPGRCEIASAPKATPPRDRIIEKFGIDRTQNEMAAPLKPEAPLMKKPWFWAAVGVIAVGTVVAIVAQNRNQSSEDVRPTNHEGW